MTSYLCENEAENLQNGYVHLVQILGFGGCKMKKGGMLMMMPGLPGQPTKKTLGLSAIHSTSGAPCRTLILRDSLPTDLRGRQL